MLRESLRKNKYRTGVALRKSSLALGLAGFSALLVVLMFIHARLQGQADLFRIRAVAEVAAKLELTDLALFTEARYTRHPSQADFHSAFQDHPTALEHFPTGSLVRPPAHLMKKSEAK